MPNVDKIKQFKGPTFLFPHLELRGPLTDEVAKCYNYNLNRRETWIRTASGAREWVVYDAEPARVYRERFMGASVFVPAILGLDLELPWAINGRRNGANDPNQTNFVEANEIGGGLDLIVLVAGQDNDYTAMHWGNNYPTMLRMLPHLHITTAPLDNADCGFMAGLVGNVGKSVGQGAFGLPDNGIFYYMDTDLGDTDAHIYVRSNGVTVHDENLGPVVLDHRGFHIHTRNSGEHVDIIWHGTKIVDNMDISGAPYAALRADQLQPYFATIARAAALGAPINHHLHDMYLIMARGF